MPVPELDESTTIRTSCPTSLPASLADSLAYLAIHRRELIVDTEAGTIHNPDGTRAERVDKRNGYGRVVVQQKPRRIAAMAHRVIWIAAHGLIPAGLQINHENRRRWDNRLANLELTTPGGNTRHAFGQRYEHCTTDTWQAVLDALLAGPDARPTGNTSIGPTPPGVRQRQRGARRSHLDCGLEKQLTDYYAA